MAKAKRSTPARATLSKTKSTDLCVCGAPRVAHGSPAPHKAAVHPNGCQGFELCSIKAPRTIPGSPEPKGNHEPKPLMATVMEAWKSQQLETYRHMDELLEDLVRKIGCGSHSVAVARRGPLGSIYMEIRAEGTGAVYTVAIAEKV